MNKNYLIAYNVSFFRDYLLDLHFLTDTLEEVKKQIDDHFQECYPLLYDAIIKKCEHFPYIFKVYELLPIHQGQD